MNSRLGAWWLIKERERPGEVVIRVSRHQTGGRRLLQSLGYQNRRGPSLPHLMRVLWVSEKRQIVRSGVFHAGDTRDLDFAIAAQFATERGCQLPEFVCHTRE